MHVTNASSARLSMGTIAIVALLHAWPDTASAEPGQACADVGAWFEPGTGRVLESAEALQSFAQANIVLLGEQHTAGEHHRWQLHTLAGLHAHNPKLVMGFEMFPRAVQPALDAWSKGESTTEEFLEAARWREVWGYDPDFYMPLFHFARQNRLPMVALNVDRDLVRRVGDDGWRAVPESERAGLTDPAPAGDDYRRRLAAVYRAKLGDEPSDEPDNLTETLESADFQHFVDAQLTWDRAMAEALANARAAHPGAVVVGVMGMGHVEYGDGVPHQLADLGETGVLTLLPVETGARCEQLDADIADAAFVVAPVDSLAQAQPKPRLGVMIDQGDGGVRVMSVIDGSVAEATGLMDGDLILTAAGQPVAGTSDLIEIVQRQAPGTWLPLEIDRNGERNQFIAKFPTTFE